MKCNELDPGNKKQFPLDKFNYTTDKLTFIHYTKSITICIPRLIMLQYSPLISCMSIEKNNSS